MTSSLSVDAEAGSNPALDQHHATLYRALRAAVCSADAAFDARLDDAFMGLPDPVRPTPDEFDTLMQAVLGIHPSAA